MCFRPADASAAGPVQCPSCKKMVQSMGGMPLTVCPFCKAPLAPSSPGAPGAPAAPGAPGAPSAPGAPGTK